MVRFSFGLLCLCFSLRDQKELAVFGVAIFFVFLVIYVVRGCCLLCTIDRALIRASLSYPAQSFFCFCFYISWSGGLCGSETELLLLPATVRQH